MLLDHMSVCELLLRLQIIRASEASGLRLIPDTYRFNLTWSDIPDSPERLET